MALGAEEEGAPPPPTKAEFLNRQPAEKPVDQKEREDIKNKAIALQEEGKYKEAIPLFEQVEDSFDNDPWFKHDFGISLIRGMDRRNVEKGIALLEDGVRIYEATGTKTALMRVSLAEAYGRADKYDEAQAQYRRVHEISPDNLAVAFLTTDDLQAETKKLYRDAEKLLNKRQPMGALVYFERALTVAEGENVVTGIVGKGRALLDLQEPEWAVQELETAFKKKRNNLPTTTYLALGYEQSGKPENARKMYENILRRDPDNELAQQGLTRIRTFIEPQQRAHKEQMERRQESPTTVEEVIENFPPVSLFEPLSQNSDPATQRQEKYREAQAFLAGIPDATKTLLEQQVNAEIGNSSNTAMGEDIIQSIKATDRDPVVGLRIIHGILELAQRQPEGMGRVITPEQIRTLISHADKEAPGNIIFNPSFPKVADVINRQLETEQALRSGSIQDSNKFISLLLLGIANETDYIQQTERKIVSDQEIADIARTVITETDRIQKLYRAGEIMYSQLHQQAPSYTSPPSYDLTPPATGQPERASKRRWGFPRRRG